MDLKTELAVRAELPTPKLARAIREHAGVSQARLARELGVARMTVCRWESGDRTPRGIHLVAYIALLSELRAGASR